MVVSKKVFIGKGRSGSPGEGVERGGDNSIVLGGKETNEIGIARRGSSDRSGWL